MLTSILCYSGAAAALICYLGVAVVKLTAFYTAVAALAIGGTLASSASLAHLYFGLSWGWTLLVAILALVLLIGLFVLYLLTRGYKKISAEVVGNIPSPPFSHQMLGHPEASTHPCKHVYRAQYCDTIESAFHQLVLMKRFIVFCNDATEAGKILSDLTIKGVVYSMFRFKPAVPDLMSAEGPEFDSRIKTLKHGMSNLEVKNPASISAALLSKLKEASESGKPLDLAKLLRLFSLDVISQSLFGYDLQAVSGSAEGEALYQVFVTRDDKLKSTGIFSNPSNRKVAPEEEVEAVTRWATYVRKLQGLVVSEVAAYESANGELKADVFTHSLVLLARRLHAEKVAGGAKVADLVLAEDDNIAAEIHSALRHGFEAIAGTLTWTLYLLYRHPEARAKLELALIKDGDSAPYLEWVIKETLRRNPVMGNFTVRTVTQEGYRVKGPDGGYVIPVQQAEGGTPINVSIFCLQNTTRTWEKPMEFTPERWDGPGSQVDGIKASHPNCPFLSRLQQQAGVSATSVPNSDYCGAGFKENSLSFFPFSAGERICRGKDFALTVIRRVVADVTKAYRLQIASADEQHDDPGASYYSSIVPVLPDSCNVLVSRLTDPGVVPKKKKVEHGWAKDDSDDEEGK